MSAAPKLTFMKDGQTVQEFELSGEAMLGRADDCGIHLDDRAISRQHALFKRVAGGVQLEKRSEFAPIRVNGVEATRAMVKEGDVIEIGPYLARVSFESNAANASSDNLNASENLVGSKPEGSFDAAKAAQEDRDQAHAASGSGAPVASDGSPPGAQQPEGAAGDDFLVAMGTPPGGEQSPESAEGAAQQGLSLEGDANALGQSLAQPDPAFAEGGAGSAGGMVDEDAATKITPSAGLIVRLHFPEGASNHTSYDMTGNEVTIGRGADCDIVLNDKKSSRKNTIIRRAGTRFVVRDLESANGTFVNGAKLPSGSERELAGDDRIRVGMTEFTFEVSSADYSSQEAAFLKPEELQLSDPSGLPGASDALGASAGGIPDLAQIAQAMEGGGQAAAGLPSSSDIAAMTGDSGFAGAGGAAGAFTPGGGIYANSNGLQNLAAGGPAGIGGTLGSIAGLGGQSNAKMTLVQRFRALPQGAQILVGLAVLGVVYFLMDEDPPVKQKPKQAQSKKVDNSKSVAGVVGGPVPFETLSAEKKKFVEMQHNLAFEAFRNRDYDQAIFHITKVLGEAQNYKDAKEILAYAQEGKRKLEQIRLEKDQKEAEIARKAKLGTMIEEIQEKMKAQKFEEARNLFPDLIALDPDNTQVIDWKKQIDDWEENRKRDAAEKAVQQDINERGWTGFKEAMALKKVKKFHSAIDTLQKVKDLGVTDQKLARACDRQISANYSAIRARREPILAQAKQFEEQGEFAKSYKAYQRATRVDPPHPAGYAGMERVRGVLHERAKATYTEAVLAESYSDFDTAKKKYQEIIDTAPEGDTYLERAKRKSARYFTRESPRDLK